jgi:hypothetical protein
VTGVAVLPLSGGLIVASNLSTIVLMPRVGPKPLVASGMLAAGGGAVWLAQLGSHTGYAAGVLGAIILAGLGLGLVIAPVINTGTFGVAPQGYDTVFWWTAGIFAGGAVIGGALLRPGRLVPRGTQSPADGTVTTAQPQAGPVRPA